MLSLDEVRENWAVIGAFAAGLIAWGETRLTARSARESATKAHTRADSAAAEMSAVKQSIARLETHAEYTREGIDEIKIALRGRPIP